MDAIERFRLCRIRHPAQAPVSTYGSHIEDRVVKEVFEAIEPEFRAMADVCDIILEHADDIRCGGIYRGRCGECPSKDCYVPKLVAALDKLRGVRGE